ncbi:MAG: transglycosylase SLT domain-containing protein [Rikenellaceae bacterium]|nr:transglycosylase SLT domain-containing protein [Rikenellaceae bacterium]
MKHYPNLTIIVCFVFILGAAPDITASIPVPAEVSGAPGSGREKKKDKKKRKETAIAGQGAVESSAPQYAEELLVTGIEEDTAADLEFGDYDFFPEGAATADAEARALAGLNVYDDARPLHFKHTPEALDSLVAKWNGDNISTNYESYFRDFIDLDSTASLDGELPDSVYSARLRRMVSPIYLGYNDIVKRYIVAYSQTRKGTIARMLGLSRVYFPMIEQELAAAGLPLELRMLPVIESALNPTAVSRMGASGLWQFMHGTGRAYGLEITSYHDERYDPVASTRAACRFLKDLYRMYGDWTLALAAYNCGPGNVNKAIKRAGGEAKTFWDIYEYLPRETRGYVPAFIGATYAFAYHRQHGIEPIPSELPVSRDTVHVNRLLHLEQVSSTLGMNLETLRTLNPQYKLDIVPAVENKVYHLTLPQYEIARYIEREQDIHDKDSIYLAQFITVDPVTNTPQITVTAASTEYRIKSGDTLGAIARKYGVTVNQLIKWNNITNPNKLRIGQRIEIRK